MNNGTADKKHRCLVLEGLIAPGQDFQPVDFQLVCIEIAVSMNVQIVWDKYRLFWDWAADKKQWSLFKRMIFTYLHEFIDSILNLLASHWFLITISPLGKWL